VQFSIIIPTFNRAQLLRRTLASLLAAVRDSRDHEILVVDNGSTDDTRDVVEHVARGADGGQLRYLREPMPGLLSGRHHGALESGGDVCAFLDDDVIVGPRWLNALNESFGDQTVGLVGGPSVPMFEAPVPEWVGNFYADHPHGRMCGWLSLFDGGREIRRTDPADIWGLNFSIRRQVLFDLGGFHPDNMPKRLQRFQGDGETGLTMKARAAGVTAMYHPDARVEHIIPAARLTIEYFEQRSFYQGVCESFSEIRKSRGLTRVERPPLDVARSTWQALKSFRGRLGEPPSLRRTRRAHRAGYLFHQREVAADAALVDWVLRPDYWDYRLPGETQ
jgi:glycosyltransferase involved in cell wall biosynthesis